MLAIGAAIAAVVAFLLALVFHLMGVGYGDTAVLVGLVAAGVWMLARSLPYARSA